MYYPCNPSNHSWSKCWRSKIFKRYPYNLLQWQFSLLTKSIIPNFRVLLAKRHLTHYLFCLFIIYCCCTLSLLNTLAEWGRLGYNFASDNFFFYLYYPHEYCVQQVFILCLSHNILSSLIHLSNLRSLCRLHRDWFVGNARIWNRLRIWLPPSCRTDEIDSDSESAVETPTRKIDGRAEFSVGKN